MSEPMTISDVLHQIRDNASNVRRGLEEIDRLAVVLYNTANEKAVELNNLKTTEIVEG